MGTQTNTDRRIRRTKAAINRAFLELLQEKSFNQITINDIAERADVNRGTIYLHYTDKYDLLDQCIAGNLDTIDHMIYSSVFNFIENKADVNESIEALKSLFIYFEEHALFFSSMLACHKTSAFRDRMLQIFTSAIQKKLDRQGINQGQDKQITTQFIASAFVGTLEWWILNQMPHSPQYMAEQVWTLFERHNIKC
ncbi:TetR/AcrR family transcriptional regulator [Sporolactobacillus shoreae]|uniref:TetR/AcrR family transcriptional regulator n=1 Tax=Sporolactobacillus shoreae TaxID=1465501 RepID=A0A4Z0GM51_9BACL|nr:TetR/AcrR family transcriptional regulator [Sporolactobacillus shoreae]TGA96908.1 TetR/AcrR family transcriptional regulator [Sporolactobacillus shoreae]